MSQSEISEHAAYLRDRIRFDAYDQALRQVIRPGHSTVLDLGAGTGILGLLAARAGARKVYSVDSGSIIATTEAIARASGYADRIVFLNESSTAVVLPEQVDVVVCDQIGGLAYDAGVLEYFHDARSRLLAPDGVMVPGSFVLYAAPVETTEWDENVGVWANRDHGFDLSPMLQLAANTEFRVDVPAGDFLGGAVEWATVQADDAAPVKGEVELIIERPGNLNGIVGMFVATLGPGVELSNCPLFPHRFDRWQNLYPLAKPIPVAPGDRVRVRFDLRPKSYVASWTVEIRFGSGGPVAKHRGSTVLGLFLTPGDIARTTGRAVAEDSPALTADRHILAQVDGRRTVDEIVESTWTGHQAAFATRDAVQRRVEALLFDHLKRTV